MFKKIFALFARYNAGERLESDLARERGEEAQRQAQEKLRAKMEEETIEVPVAKPLEEVPTIKPSEVPGVEAEDELEQAA